MNLGQLIGMLRYPELRSSSSDPLRPSAQPPLGTVTRSSDLLQTVVPPAAQLPAPAPTPTPTPPAAVAPLAETAERKPPLRKGTTEKILRILAAHPDGLTSVGINERLGGPFINVAALLADPRKRGDVEVQDAERPFVYRITAKGRARL